MIREMIQNIGQKAEQWFASKQEPMETIFFERMGVIVSSPVNGAICRSLCSGPLEIGILTEAVNDIFNQTGLLETYHDVPVEQQTIKKQLGTMSRYGLVEQEEEGNWTLTKSGQEVIESLTGKSRTEEQELMDYAELIGREVLNLSSPDLRRFVQNFRRFVPIIRASINRDTISPFGISSDGKIVEETVRNLRRAWENFGASSGRTGHPDKKI
jgi:hypothetical protein